MLESLMRMQVNYWADDEINLKILSVSSDKLWAAKMYPLKTE